LGRFHSNQGQVFTGIQLLSGFNGAMHASPRPIGEGAAWFVEADRGQAHARGRTGPRGGLQRGETSLRAVIASSLFLVLLASGLLVGGHAAIDPLLRSAVAARQARALGDVLYRMPDGKYCRHMSFDNSTAEIFEGPVERCSADMSDERHHESRSFSWGEH
jgi:hypothetical protein